MLNTTVPSLASTSQQVVISLGFCLLVAGSIGNPLTLIVFLSLQTFRHSSCAFYLTVMSFINIFHLFTGLFTHIMIYGFNINWLNMSVVYCKFRPFYVQLCAMSSSSCMCLATIDQFLATCSSPRCQRLCNIKLARQLVIGLIIIWFGCGISFLIYYNHVGSDPVVCDVTNRAFNKFNSVFYGPFMMSILPMIIMILFAILAYRNVQQIAYRTVPLVRRELDKQLTTMVLVHVIYAAISVTPGAIFNLFKTFYPLIIDQNTTEQLRCIKSLTTTVYYFNHMGSLYIYVCVSKRFRQQLLYVLSKICFKRYPPGNPNRIKPET
ncbi:unnamed protein product [Adineta ricciae]|uniref:G-protein coupled receptors family 1 profile domain-containing protein n=2 Tax=Adineta ricciae TaxID=249248 RepID=A0A816G454_ADIRI|nr:unnamed protein product [Adineta ricciae]